MEDHILRLSPKTSTPTHRVNLFPETTLFPQKSSNFPRKWFISSNPKMISAVWWKRPPLSSTPPPPSPSLPGNAGRQLEGISIPPRGFLDRGWNGDFRLLCPWATPRVPKTTGFSRRNAQRRHMVFITDKTFWFDRTTQIVCKWKPHGGNPSPSMALTLLASWTPPANHLASLAEFPPLENRNEIDFEE